MNYKIELKTTVLNDKSNRMPSIERFKDIIDEYSVGFKGIVLLHDSLYDYRYDTKLQGYHSVDSNTVIGRVTSTVIEDGKLYLIVDCIRELDTNKQFICGFRSKLESKSGSVTFDSVNVFAIDLVSIGENENVPKENLSEVFEYSV